MNSFFVETFNRLFKSRSPAFFIRLRMIVGLAAFANYIPSILQRWFEVTTPPGMINLCEDIAKYCTGVFAASFLSTKTPSVGQTEAGANIQVTDVEKLPFTAKAEAKAIEKAEPPPPVVADVTEKPTTPDV